MPCTSLREAEMELAAALTKADDWHDHVMRALPDNHTWKDVDLIGRAYNNLCIEAHKAYEKAQIEWEAFVASSIED